VILRTPIPRRNESPSPSRPTWRPSACSPPVFVAARDPTGRAFRQARRGGRRGVDHRPARPARALDRQRPLPRP